MPDASTRQWTFSAFEWTIKHVAALRDHVESISSDVSGSSSGSDVGVDDDGVPLVLKQSPMIGENGENKFKVEIARTPSPEDQRSPTPTAGSSPTSVSATSKAPTLSLYVTSLFLDFAHTEYEFCSAIMLAIKSREDRAGDRGARSDWVWEHWEPEFAFRKGNEFWECQLPTLSSLLAHPRIAAHDSFVLCIQIHSPVGFYPQFPQAYYVPKDLLEGLEASLDNPNTGDVRFVTLEWYESQDNRLDDTGTPHSSSSSSSVSTLARKRTLYAHSDVLKRRSEYFATMLASAFAESTTTTYSHPAEAAHPPRRIHDIIVTEADFITVYWLLKWVYADWILFKEEDDPKGVMTGLGGWSVHSLSPVIGRPGQGEWDWRTIRGTNERLSSAHQQGEESPGAAEREDDEHSHHETSVRSASSAGTTATVPEGVLSDSAGKGKQVAYPSAAGPSRGGGPSSSRGGRTSVMIGSRTASASLNPPVSRRPGAPTSPNKAAPLAPSSAQPSSSQAARPTSSVSPQRSRYPPSIHASSSASASIPPGPTPDPHLHPTSELPPASALAIYQVAHRYGLSGLQQLALEHMMSTINPKSSFPLLLATRFWEEVHLMVEDYIVEHFDLVSRSEVFDQCCEEIAAGEWGPEGGRTLAALFRRLTSPQGIRYARP